MAKKGNKQPATSKKAEQKKKAGQIDDRTFGLKNKNKSKKVQSFVRSVTNSVNNSGDRKQRHEDERRRRQKEEQKLRKKAMKEEANALFNEGEFGWQKVHFFQSKLNLPISCNLSQHFSILRPNFFLKHWGHSIRRKLISKEERSRPREETQMTKERRKEPLEQ
jgi:hypothetical protein